MAVDIRNFSDPPRPEGAEEPEGLGGIEATIRRLAALHPMDYEKVREAEAAGLGCRVSVLDEQVKAARPRKPAESKNGGTPALCPQTELWPGLVVPSQLLDEIKATIKTLSLIHI